MNNAGVVVDDAVVAGGAVEVAVDDMGDGAGAVGNEDSDAAAAVAAAAVAVGSTG